MITIPIDLVQIEDDGFHIFISALINGKKARMLVDTGASRTVFDEERIKSFIREEDQQFGTIDKLSTGLGTNSMEGKLINLSEFALGEAIFNDYLTVVLNLEHVNRSYGMLGYPEIDGVLGGDLLSGLKAIIDYRKREIRWR